MVTDRNTVTSNGFGMLFLSLALVAVSVGLIFATLGWGAVSPVTGLLAAALTFVAGLVLLSDIYSLGPNESGVMTFFVRYVGTDSEPGLRWTHPFYVVTKVSRKAINYNIQSIKVNDAAGNPIEIGASIVCNVNDAAKATFEVEDYHRYLKIQSESSLRKIASIYPYDNWHDKDDEKSVRSGISLRDGGDEVASRLREELAEHLAVAGLDVADARITHLAYSPEIAPAMLKRQQIAATFSARGLAASAAVSIVEKVITDLGEKGVKLDDERKATMATNLLVCLIGDREATPVINAGSLY